MKRFAIHLTESGFVTEKPIKRMYYCSSCKNNQSRWAFRKAMLKNPKPICQQCESFALLGNGMGVEKGSHKRICHLPGCSKEFVASNKFIRFCPDCKGQKEELKEEVDFYKIVY